MDDPTRAPVAVVVVAWNSVDFLPGCLDSLRRLERAPAEVVVVDNNSTDEYLTGELEGAIINFQKYYNKTPIAVVWPGGGFGLRPVQFARQFGYRLGFTVNPRGPLMYNWVPQSNEKDPGRPYYIPEGPVGDPLMTFTTSLALRTGAVSSGTWKRTAVS